MPRFAAVLFAAMTLVISLRAAEPVLPIRVTLDGKPAPGAQVWLALLQEKESDKKFLGPLVADAAGEVKFPVESDRFVMAFAKGGDYRFGIIDSRGNRGNYLANPLIQITLQKTAVMEGRLTFEGKPLKGVKCQLDYIQMLKRNPDFKYDFSNFYYPDWLDGRKSTSDADGRFRFRLPSELSAIVHFESAGLAKGIGMVESVGIKIFDMVKAGSLKLTLEGEFNRNLPKEMY